MHDDEDIIGFYTLSPYLINADLLKPFLSKRKIGPYPTLPVFLLGRLAVDERFKNRGFGSFLVSDAIKRIGTNEIRSLGLVVEAKDERALTYYLKQGFVFLEGRMAIFLF